MFHSFNPLLVLFVWTLLGRTFTIFTAAQSRSLAGHRAEFSVIAVCSHLAHQRGLLITRWNQLGLSCCWVQRWLGLDLWRCWTETRTRTQPTELCSQGFRRSFLLAFEPDLLRCRAFPRPADNTALPHSSPGRRLMHGDPSLGPLLGRPRRPYPEG